MLYTKSIHKPIETEDGIRISVMSRHTLDDGLTSDPRITGSSFEIWWRLLAPPDKLVGDYYKRGLPFEEYARQYLEYISERPAKIEVIRLASLASVKDVTLLCVEESAEKCHRRLLAENCREYNPELAVKHR